ncbi:hypothetical protein C0Q70_10497 [Pomacea canaliculata]|uniref:UFSP1/2/DUB catalytic domain-containing protein n=2 Tax=Pomacea canaliculata TaxID=400727 RepID=A0A2T7P3B7_POMCA|nr:inactive Ufm1-specific protease 1-like isoform X2 [Pomacea canaliculata]XP_025099557.1 inactive Ufm1-specific protease 1-like isoform X2 [Pomacea canaliculata]XP_025099558.1 inactive Ufm1-specific protease 1-like isoform X2 [Pomacea canaliculata]PVD27922.1 hypothetical protein C0Q70_10497 [Pomacea canaliculata]
MCSWIKYQLEATNQDLCSTSYPEDDSTPLHLHNEDAYGICVIASVEDSVSSSITRHENTLSDIGVSDKITQNISLGVGKASINEVPSIPNAQEALVTIGDKPSEFYGSHQWIGSYEVCLCIDYFFKVPCRILHVSKGSELKQHLSALKNHFKNLGSPVMMGGDTDNASKGILGVCTRPAALLVLDPHYYGPVSDVATLQAAGFIRWTPIEDFHENSFYNFCIPQLAAAEEKQQII